MAATVGERTVADPAAAELASPPRGAMVGDVARALGSSAGRLRALHEQPLQDPTGTLDLVPLAVQLGVGFFSEQTCRVHRALLDRLPHAVVAKTPEQLQAALRDSQLDVLVVGGYDWRRQRAWHTLVGGALPPRLRELYAPRAMPGVGAVARLQNLRALDLCGNNVGDAGCKAVGRLPHLRHLDLSSNDISDAGIALLLGGASAAPTGLRWLDLLNNALSDAAAELLAAKLPALTGLDLCANAAITSAGAAALAALGGLRYLDLGLTAVGDDGLRALGALGDLRYLDLRHSAVTTAGCAFVPRTVAALGLRYTPGVTDEAVAGVLALPALTSLDLSGAALTEKGVDALCRAARWRLGLAITIDKQARIDAARFEYSVARMEMRWELIRCRKALLRSAYGSPSPPAAASAPAGASARVAPADSTNAGPGPLKQLGQALFGKKTNKVAVANVEAAARADLDLDLDRFVVFLRDVPEHLFRVVVKFV